MADNPWLKESDVFQINATVMVGFPWGPARSSGQAPKESKFPDRKSYHIITVAIDGIEYAWSMDFDLHDKLVELGLVKNASFYLCRKKDGNNPMVWSVSDGKIWHDITGAAATPPQPPVQSPVQSTPQPAPQATPTPEQVAPTAQPQGDVVSMASLAPSIPKKLTMGEHATLYADALLHARAVYRVAFSDAEKGTGAVSMEDVRTTAFSLYKQVLDSGKVEIVEGIQADIANECGQIEIDISYAKAHLALAE